MRFSNAFLEERNVSAEAEISAGKIIISFILTEDEKQRAIKKLEVIKNDSVSDLTDGFSDFITSELQIIEKEIDKIVNPPELNEGAEKQTFTTRYERNPAARKACLDYHGTSCAVCGIDFGKVYGKAFEGKIEVHHKVPVSEIGKNYVVDPINDLIPVCPNCHTALHSKKNGCYTVEELVEMRNGN